MNRKTWFLLAIGLASILLVLASCGTPEPTAEALPPTSTSAPPTPTATAAAPVPVSTDTPQAQASPEAPALSRATRYAIFDQTWTLIRDHYVYADFRGLDWEAVREEYSEKVTSAEGDQAFYDLLREMVDRLGDQHSIFLSPDAVALEEAFYEDLQVPGGIGVYLVEDQGELVLAQVLPDNPAFEAGLRPGERIVAIDGLPTERFASSDEMIRAIIGEAETEVVLTVRALDGAEREVAVTRAVIDLDEVVVQGLVIEGTQIGLLTIGSFDSAAIPDIVRETLGGLVDSGPLDGLIVDLRANLGGDVDVMLGTLALFLPGGSIGRDVGREDAFDLLIPEGHTMPELEGLPIIVLIGPYTQSASEGFAAGMQLHGRATIVGLPSAGNTETISWRSLSDGSVLRLAEWVYQLPDGTVIEGRGVQPDRVVEGDFWRYGPADDPQIQAAIEVLSPE